MGFSWSFITENLATGGKIDEPRDVDKLLRAGITHCLDLQLNTQDSEWLKAAPIQYLNNGTADNGKPKPTSWFETSMKFAMPALVSGGKVYCHCTAGVNRGPSTAYFLLRVQHWTAMKARWRIYLKRPRTLFGLRYADDAERALKELGLGS